MSKFPSFLGAHLPLTTHSPAAPRRPKPLRTQLAQGIRSNNAFCKSENLFLAGADTSVIYCKLKFCMRARMHGCMPALAWTLAYYMRAVNRGAVNRGACVLCACCKYGRVRAVNMDICVLKTHPVALERTTYG